MPTVFIGHGSPMNAILETEHTHVLQNLHSRWPKPKSILVISAHWQSQDTKVLKVDKPKTIHDFGGFPQELYQIQYPAPGASALAERVHELASQIDLTNNWGLDHGAWCVLRRMYPAADIPVTQLSLSRALNYRQHFELGQKLKPLRDEGVLILGSGNLVHNLGVIKWQVDAPPFDWAKKFDSILREKLLARDLPFFLNPEGETAAMAELAHLSIPTLEHYLPALYVLGASDASDQLEFVYEGLQNASISMRSFMLG